MKKNKKTYKEAINVAVLGNDGGCGKSFIATHLAWALAERGREVCFLDTDYSQGSGSYWLGLDFDKKGKDIEYGDGLIHIENLKKDFTEKDVPDGYDVYVWDGRPEMEVNSRIASVLPPGSVIIIPVDGFDSVRQARLLAEFINKNREDLRIYGIRNKSARSNIEIRIARAFEESGITAFYDTLPATVYVRQSEADNIPVWDIKGARKHKFHIVFDIFAHLLLTRRL